MDSEIRTITRTDGRVQKVYKINRNIITLSAASFNNIYKLLQHFHLLMDGRRMYKNHTFHVLMSWLSWFTSYTVISVRQVIRRL